MALHRVHDEPFQVYFCTITCYKWLPLFEEGNAYDSVYQWFRHLPKDGCQLVGYVIMPNHLHCLLLMRHSGTSLNRVVAEGKRFMAYDIVKRLKALGKTDVLRELENGVPANEKRKGKLHQVFHLSFDARECTTEKLVEQKLDYIHHNPVSGKWDLASDFTKYPHSSVAYYERDEENEHLIHYKSVTA